jgi:hypothetical protein
MIVLVIGRGRRIVDAVVTAMGRRGIEGVGVTRDDEAFGHLDGGRIDLLVIGGGVQRASRRHLAKSAHSHGVQVVEAPLANRDIETYLQEEIIPRLGRR